MKTFLLVVLAAVLLSACNVSKPISGNAHTYKEHYRENGDKAESCTLVSVKYTRRGYRHEFIAPDGCIILRFLPHKEDIGDCYLLKRYMYRHN